MAIKCGTGWPAVHSVKVSLVFSDYRGQFPSGEREVVHAEHRALERAGLDVQLVTASTDAGMRLPFYGPRAAARVASGFGRSPLEDLESFAPDVVHVHNIFPNFGHRWLARLRRPLVLTLHNYRAICAQGSLYREGSPCTLCPDGRRWSAIRHRCYRDSAIATIPLALANAGGLSRDPLVQRADAVVVVSSRQQAIFRRYGLPEAKTILSPSFLPDSVLGTQGQSGVRAGWLFVGRMDAQKGPLDLLAHWPTGEALTAVGDGPQLQAVRDAAPIGTLITGRASRETVVHLMTGVEGLVFTSTAYETQGLVYLEALAAGTPVISLRGSATADAVESEGTGVVIDDLSQFSEAMSEVRDRWQLFSQNCITSRVENYSEAVWVEQRLKLYSDLVDHAPMAG